MSEILSLLTVRLIFIVLKMGAGWLHCDSMFAK